ncbi:MAG: ComF family protein [Curvibacter lanceolatus]|nr:ComF family protein [Curvibacter lanceolatus]
MLGRLFEAVMTRIPSQCAVCRAWPAQRVCEECVRRFARPVPRCRRCAIHVLSGQPICGPCLLHPPTLSSCHAALDYAFPWSACIADFKFHDDPSWAGMLGQLMMQAPGVADAVQQADWVLPIPLSRHRLRERGYNQAALLAQQLTRDRLQPDLLWRLQDTPAQASLTRAQRLRNLRHSFALNPGQTPLLKDRRVLLIDDVMTTGATLHSAARVLRQAGGAREVHACVLARTPAPC